MNSSEYFLPQNDYVFKKLFGYIGSENITSNLFESVVKNHKVNTITLDQNPFTEKDLMSDKLGILDIKATVNNNIPCNLEMQVIPKKYLAKRIIFYWSKLFISTIQSGQSYEKLNKTIVILFANFELDEIDSSLADITDFHTKWCIHEDTHHEYILSDVFEIHIISLKTLEKFENLDYNIDDIDLINWAKFIKNPNSLEASAMNNIYIKEAKEKFDKLKDDEHERALAESRMKYIRDMNAIQDYGYDKGFEKGSKNKSIEIAKNMLKENLDINLIIKLTGLSKEEIEKLN